jgi:uncharacterized protein with PQ loop repeat
MINLLGYVAMFFLIIAALPQVVKTFKEGHSDGLAGGYIVLLLVGFSLMATYLFLTKPVIPVILNYLFNIVMISILGFYKLFPRSK